MNITIIGPVIGLAANLVTGLLAKTIPLGRLLAVAMLLMVLALIAFPFVKTELHVYLYAATFGISGGMITVLFFAVWARCFGSRIWDRFKARHRCSQSLLQHWAPICWP